MKLILDTLVLAGWWLALGYLFAAVIMTITIIGIPFAKQALKLAVYALWPFGRMLIPAESRSKGLSVFANILWFVLAGWWLALGQLIAGCLLCITIVGIPLGHRLIQDGGRGARPVRQADREREGSAGGTTQRARVPLKGRSREPRRRLHAARPGGRRRAVRGKRVSCRHRRQRGEPLTRSCSPAGP